MKIYYVANARIPTEKAHGIQIAKTCEALIEAGADLTLIAPRRSTVEGSMESFYGLRMPVRVQKLWAPDTHLIGRPGYLLAALWFMASYVLFLWGKLLSGERFVMYTVDLDYYSSSALALVPAPLFTEMHGAKRPTIMQRLLFGNAAGVIPINDIIRKELQGTFPRARARYLVEPNGVEAAMFAPIDKQEARKRLGLPADARIALYTGRFFDWKGLEIIAQAARIADPSIRWYLVGGTREHFEEFVKDPIPESIVFVGSVPHAEIPLWLSAADALLVLGTKRDTQSYWWTSPMKLFEYFIVERPIIASRTPAIEAITGTDAVAFYEPDSPESLAAAAAKILIDGDYPQERIEAAKRLGLARSWTGRATRILSFIHDAVSAHEKRA